MDLVGYFSFVRSGPAFLVPIFSQIGSDELYSHFLNDDNRIESFFKINAREYEYFEYPNTGIRRSEGDVGVIGVRLSNGSVRVDSKEEIRSFLSSSDLAWQGGKFFNVDVTTFLGDELCRRMAIKAIEPLFSDYELFTRWADREVHFGKLAGSGSDEEAMPVQPELDFGDLEEKYRWLKSNPGATNWISVWLSLWRSTFSRTELLELSLRWLDQEVSQTGLVPLFKVLLRQRSANNFAYARIVRWLKRNDQFTMGWARMWALACEVNINSGSRIEELYYLGIESFRGNSVAERRASIESLTLVWSWLRRISGGKFSFDLCKSVIEIMPVYALSVIFRQRILTPVCLHCRNDEKFINELNHFFVEHEVNKVWAEILCVVSKYFKIKNNVHSMAIEYLKNTKKGNRAWLVEGVLEESIRNIESSK